MPATRYRDVRIGDVVTCGSVVDVVALRHLLTTKLVAHTIFGHQQHGSANTVVRLYDVDDYALLCALLESMFGAPSRRLSTICETTPSMESAHA